MAADLEKLLRREPIADRGISVVIPACDSADVLEAGEKLRIPLEQGIIHTVISAETLSEIARRYGVAPEAITAIAGNAISDGDLVSAGAELLVPNPTKLGRLAVPARTPPSPAYRTSAAANPG